MVNNSAQIPRVIVSLNVWKLTWRNSCKSQSTLWSVENGKTMTSGRFLLHCMVGILLEQFMVFLRNNSTNQSWNHVFHVFRLFHYNFLSSTTYMRVFYVHEFLHTYLNIMWQKRNMCVVCLHEYTITQKISSQTCILHPLY